jgi:hypothetical protein
MANPPLKHTAEIGPGIETLPSVRKIDFLIMGFQKSGTTALTYFLMQHPEIYIPRDKEIHFFDDDAFFERQRALVDYTAYHKNFEAGCDARLTGEATPIYAYWKPSAPRIKQYNPHIKMIFLLRNPIDRAYSHYMLQRALGREPLSFSSAIRLERFLRLSDFPRQSRERSYVDRGFYTRQIRRLLRHFSRSQMLFIKTDDLRNDHSGTLDRVFDFLGVRRMGGIEPANINTNEYDPMSARDRAYLERRFRNEIRELEELLGWDCSGWAPS